MVSWQFRKLVNWSKVPTNLRYLLLHQGSLTRYLDQLCNGFITLELLDQCWIKTDYNELWLLKKYCGQSVLLREVLLKYDNRPLVYAKTLIPVYSLLGKNRILKRRGRQPLGTLLFSASGDGRRYMQYARINVPATVSSCVEGSNTVVWARRSLFGLSGKPLLITEFFLPAICEYQ